MPTRPCKRLDVSSVPVIVAIFAALPGCATTPQPPNAPPDPIVWRTTRCTEAPAQWQASCHSVHQRMGIADDTASPLLFPGPAGDARNATAAEAVDRLLASYGGYTGVEPGVAILIGDGAIYVADTAPRSSLLPTAAATCVMTAHMHARDASRIHDAVRR
jgi:hypothetical protein